MIHSFSARPRTWVALNLAGALLVFVGSQSALVVYLGGFLLLLPGSLVAALIPFHKLWLKGLWRCCQTNADGLSDVLYLPTAFAMNALTWFLIRLYARRRSLPRQAP